MIGCRYPSLSLLAPNLLSAQLALPLEEPSENVRENPVVIGEVEVEEVGVVDRLVSYVGVGTSLLAVIVDLLAGLHLPLGIGMVLALIAEVEGTGGALRLT